jgi:hypothetical protein
MRRVMSGTTTRIEGSIAIRVSERHSAPPGDGCDNSRAPSRGLAELMATLLGANQSGLLRPSSRLRVGLRLALLCLGLSAAIGAIACGVVEQTELVTQPTWRCITAPLRRVSTLRRAPHERTSKRQPAVT